MRDPAALVLLAASLGVLGVAGAWWLSRRPAMVIAVALFSPLASALLKGNSEDAEMAESGPGGYIRVSLLLAAGLAGLLAFVRSRSRLTEGRGLPGQFLWLGAFLLMALVSASWSVDPSYTLVRAGSFVALGGFLAGVLAWSREPGGVERVLDALFAFCAVWALANLAAMALWPSRVWWWNATSRFQGLGDHPNSMGGFCMIAYPVFLWKLLRLKGSSRIALIGLVAAVAIMQVLSGSRSSMIGAGVGILIFLVASRRRLAAAVFAGAVALMLAVIVAHPPESLQRQVSDDAAVNLTGRPDIWNAYWRLFELRPLTGYGFETQNKLLQDYELQKLAGVNWTVLPTQSTHNGYLSVALGGGIVAFLLWLGVLLIPFVGCLDLKKVHAPGGGARASPLASARSLVLAVMTMGLATNMVESIITGGASLPAVIFWMAWALAGRLWESPERLADGLAASGGGGDRRAGQPARGAAHA